VEAHIDKSSKYNRFFPKYRWVLWEEVKFVFLKDNFLKNGGLIFVRNNEKSNGNGVRARLKKDYTFKGRFANEV
jgi:hypothetical protein